MNRISRLLLGKPGWFAVFLVVAAALGTALYLQHYEYQTPCPLCVMQRYALIGIGVFALAMVAGLPPRIGRPIVALKALGGGATAIWQLHELQIASTSCGIDPLAAAVNHLWPARWLPGVFYADGLCGIPTPPFLGLSLPLWGLLLFNAVFFFALLPRKR